MINNNEVIPLKDVWISIYISLKDKLARVYSSGAEFYDDLKEVIYALLHDSPFPNTFS